MFRRLLTGVRPGVVATATAPHMAVSVCRRVTTPIQARVCGTQIRASPLAASSVIARFLSADQSNKRTAKSASPLNAGASSSSSTDGGSTSFVDPLTKPYGIGRDQLSALGRSFGRDALTRLGVGAGLSALTTGGLFAAGLLGAHPIFWGVFNVAGTMCWAIVYSQVIGMASVAGRSITEFGGLQMVLQPLLQTIPIRATDSVEQFLIELHRESKSLAASPTPGMQGYIEKRITRLLDMVMKQLPSRIQAAMDDIEREKINAATTAAASAAPTASPTADPLSADTDVTYANVLKGANANAASAPAVSPFRLDSGSIDVPLFHRVVLTVTQQIMVEQIRAYHKKTTTLMWAIYALYMALFTYLLTAIRHQNEKKAKAAKEKAAAIASGTYVPTAADKAKAKVSELSSSAKQKVVSVVDVATGKPKEPKA